MNQSKNKSANETKSNQSDDTSQLQKRKQKLKRKKKTHQIESITKLIIRTDTDQNHSSDHSEVSHFPVTEKETKPCSSGKNLFSSAHSPLHHTDTQTNHTNTQTKERANAHPSSVHTKKKKKEKKKTTFGAHDVSQQRTSQRKSEQIQRGVFAPRQRGFASSCPRERDQTPVFLWKKKNPASVAHFPRLGGNMPNSRDQKTS